MIRPESWPEQRLSEVVPVERWPRAAKGQGEKPGAGSGGRGTPPSRPLQGRGPEEASWGSLVWPRLHTLQAARTVWSPGGRVAGDEGMTEVRCHFPFPSVKGPPLCGHRGSDER